MGRLWRMLPAEMPEGELEERGTPTVWWCVSSPLSLFLWEQDKTAEGAYFSLLNWLTLECSHALYGNKKSQGVAVGYVGKLARDKVFFSGFSGPLKAPTQTKPRVWVATMTTVPVIFINYHLAHYILPCSDMGPCSVHFVSFMKLTEKACLNAQRSCRRLHVETQSGAAPCR